MSKLFLALILSLVGHIMAWFHMQAQFKWEFAKSYWWIILGRIPICFAFYYSTRWYYEHFERYWYVRPIGFGMATIVFSFLTWLLLSEVPDTKTWVCVMLSAIIIFIQLSNFK